MCGSGLDIAAGGFRHINIISFFCKIMSAVLDIMGNSTATLVLLTGKTLENMVLQWCIDSVDGALHTQDMSVRCAPANHSDYGLIVVVVAVVLGETDDKLS